jgi:hypothetical protein
MEPTFAAFSPLLSVIVPVAPREDQWPGLAGLVAALPVGSEVLFTGPKAPLVEEGANAPLARAWDALRRTSGDERRVSWVRSPLGRARQLNVAAKAAGGRYLWFVHADSRVDAAGVAALAAACAAGRDALLWFDLAFAPESARLDALMGVTARAVALRSRVLRLPFGDQALCLPRRRFFECGAFDEDAPYGEDHLFVWRARQLGLPLAPVGAAVTTSARRYRDRGWAKTTLRHVALTFKQATPEAWRLLTQGKSLAKPPVAGGAP